MYSPKEVAQNYIATGASKTKLPVGKLLVLAVLAGMFIALAGLGATVASSSIVIPSVAKLVGACVFPVGLAMVLIAGSELFTGNCLIIISVLEKQATVLGMLKNWLVVIAGNFVGAVFVAFLAVDGHILSLFSNAAAVNAVHTAFSKVTFTWGDAFIRGMLCNFLVCMGVWIALAAKDVVGKVAGLYLPVMLFVLSGFEHNVANMYYIAAGIFAKGDAVYAAAAAAANGRDNLALLNWGTYFTHNIIPVTLGNLVGGVVMVGMPYWFVYLRSADKKPVGQGRSR